MQQIKVPQQGQNRIFDLLPRVMRIDDENPSRAAVTAISNLQMMFEAVDREIGQSFDKKSTCAFHKRPLGNLQGAFNPLVLGGNWEQHRANLRAEDLTGLDYTAHAIEEISREVTLEEVELKEVLKTVEDAIDELRSSNLHGDAKFLLEQALDNVRNAVQGYRFGGLDGLKRAIAFYAGAVAFCADEMKTGVEPKAMEKFWGVISKTSDLITMGQATWIGSYALLSSGAAVAIAALAK